MVVGLGALGAVTRLTLDVEPAYEVRQRVFEGLKGTVVRQLRRHHGERLQRLGLHALGGGSRPGVGQEPCLRRARSRARRAVRCSRRDPRPASDPRHRPGEVHAQLGVPGPWSDRLPHFRMGFTPSNGDELQSEFLVSREHAVAAIGAVRQLADTIRPLLQVCEIRTIASDGLWMSPQYGRDSVGIHFTWHPHQAAVQRALALLEAALAPFGARPHWGKLFVAEAATVAPLYPRHADFARSSTDSTRAKPSGTPGSNATCWAQPGPDGSRQGRSSTHPTVTRRRPCLAASRCSGLDKGASDNSPPSRDPYGAGWRDQVQGFTVLEPAVGMFASGAHRVSSARGIRRLRTPG